MCLGIPGRIVELRTITPTSPGSTSKASSGTSTWRCSRTIRPKPGDWILIHLGFALQRMTEAEAGTPSTS